MFFTAQVQEPLLVEEKKVTKEEIHKSPSNEPITKDTPEKEKPKINMLNPVPKLNASPLSSTSDKDGKETHDNIISRSITPTPNLTMEKNSSEKSNFNTLQSIPIITQSDPKLTHHYSNHKTVIQVSNKGMVSPKNDTTQIPSFKVVSPSVESNLNKPTAISILEKRKLNLDSLTLGSTNNNYNISSNTTPNHTNNITSGMISSNLISKTNYEGMVSSNLTNKSNYDGMVANKEEEKKNEKTSRLTSPKQIDTVISLMENKEKGSTVEIEKIIPGNKTFIKNFSNAGFFNSIQVLPGQN